MDKQIETPLTDALHARLSRGTTWSVERHIANYEEMQKHAVQLERDRAALESELQKSNDLLFELLDCFDPGYWLTRINEQRARNVEVIASLSSPTQREEV